MLGLLWILQILGDKGVEKDTKNAAKGCAWLLSGITEAEFNLALQSAMIELLDIKGIAEPKAQGIAKELSNVRKSLMKLGARMGDFHAPTA